MIEVKVSFSETQVAIVDRLVGCVATSRSAVVRYLVQSYILEHGDRLLKEIERFEAWKDKQ